jgi:poly-gamma-glutamate biosynthesis protein PgsC/CapC
MSEVEILYIGIGLVVSLLYAEMFSISPGGIIVPGYLALGVHEPATVLATFAVSLVTFFAVRVLATVTIIYGRRRTVLMLLIAFLVGSLVRAGFDVAPLVAGLEIDVIGYIVPGLIAIWMDRQGVVVSVSSALTASVSTRLIALLILGL